MRAALPPRWSLLALGATSFCLTLGYQLYASGSPLARRAATPALLLPAPSRTAPVAPAVIASRTEANLADTAELDRTLAEAMGDFAEQRLAAIQRLADAPRARALPVLLTLLETGPLLADRQAALDALLAQARQQGDSDGRIHDALRDRVYDGNDEAVSARAAEVLEQLDSGSAG